MTLQLLDANIMSAVPLHPHWLTNLDLVSFRATFLFENYSKFFFKKVPKVYSNNIKGNFEKELKIIFKKVRTF